MTIQKILQVGFMGLLIMIAAIIFTKILNSPQSVTATNLYAFAFIRANQLGFLNPNMSGTSPALFTLSPSGIPLVAKSPDGKWIAIAMRTPYQPTTQIELFDVLAGKESHPIQVGKGFYTENQEMTTPDSLARNMSWSPDSQHLALSMFGPEHADIYLYSVRTQAVTDLTENDPAWHYGIGWTNDSDYLVTAGESCANDTGCTAQLKLQEFNLHGGIAKAIDVTNLYTGAGGSSICNMQSSPQDRYIAFISSCDLYGNVLSVEIYLWDLSLNKIETVTNMAKRGPLDALGPHATYNILWVNSDQMLISAAIYKINTSSPQTSTFFYQASENLKTSISSDFIDQWTVNSVSGQLAYNLIEANTINSAHAQTSVKLATINVPTQTNTTIIQDQTTTLVAQIANGCDLAWSPDGRYLAFAIGTDLNFINYSRCKYGQPTAIGISDTLNSNIQQYSLPSESQIENQPIGWVVAPGQSNPAPTASPTAIRSPAAPGSGSVPGGNQIGG